MPGKTSRGSSRPDGKDETESQKKPASGVGPGVDADKETRHAENAETVTDESTGLEFDVQTLPDNDARSAPTNPPRTGGPGGGDPSALPQNPPPAERDDQPDGAEAPDGSKK